MVTLSRSISHVTGHRFNITYTFTNGKMLKNQVVCRLTLYLYFSPAQWNNKIIEVIGRYIIYTVNEVEIAIEPDLIHQFLRQLPKPSQEYDGFQLTLEFDIFYILRT